MNQINEESFNKFLERLKVERELLDGCNAEAGYFQRISTHFLPFLRKDSVSSVVVSRWQQVAEDLSLIERASDQLNVAFVELWKHAVHSKNWSLRRHLIQILRSIRGPARYVDISLSGHSPISQAADSLRPLYVEHIARVRADHFSFLPAVRVLEQRARQFSVLVDNDPTLLWSEMITLENCQLLKETPIFWLRWKTILGEKTKIAIRAYHQWHEYVIAGAAEELTMSKGDQHKPRYFVREKFARKIDRLCMELNKELKLLIVKTNQSKHQESTMSTKQKKPHGRTMKTAVDRASLLPIGIAVWKEMLCNVSLENLKNFSQRAVAEEIERRAKKRGIHLYLDVTARYFNVAKETDPRLWNNGACLGLKPGYSFQEGGV